AHPRPARRGGHLRGGHDERDPGGVDRDRELPRADDRRWLVRRRIEVARTRVLALALALAAAAQAAPAYAAPVREEGIATQPLALVARGVSASYERRIAERVSAVAIGGIRAAALEDYSSRTFTVGGELRAWLRQRTPMRGPFLAFHASAGYTRLSDDVMGNV